MLLIEKDTTSTYTWCNKKQQSKIF